MGNSESLGIDYSACNQHLIVVGNSQEKRNLFCRKLLESALASKVTCILICNGADDFSDFIESHGLSVTTYGAPDSSLHCVNPLDIAYGASIPNHIEMLTKLFTCTYSFSPYAQFGLRRSLHKAYENCSWSLVDSKNSRLADRRSDHYEPFSIPCLNDVFELLTKGLSDSGLEGIITKDAKISITSNLLPLTTARDHFIFSSRSTIPVQTVFSKSTIFDLSKCQSKEHRSIYIGNLLIQAQTHIQQNPDGKLLFIANDMHKASNIFKGAGSDNQSDFLQDLLDTTIDTGLNIVLTSNTSQASHKSPIVRCGRYFIDEIKRNNERHWISRSIEHLSKEMLEKLKPDQYIEVDDQCQYRNYADIKDSKIPPPDAIQHKIKLVDKKHIPLPLLNSAMNMYEDGQDLDVYLSALEVAKDRHFKKIFRCFILSFLCDLTQLVHYRGKIIATVQSILGRIDGASLPISSITFTALALESDQYFFEKARFYSWSYKEENAVKKLWLDLMHSAFLPGENKKIDITKLRSFREFLFRLQERSEGPEPGCINCEAKCNYKTEVEEILELEPYLLNDFTSAINRKDNVPSTAAAEFSKYITESFASQYNADIAYCFLNHLTSMHQISTEGQLTMLFKARQHLLFPEKISEPE